MSLVQEGVVQMFHNAVVLWCVSGGDFVLDAAVLKVLLDMAGHIFAPSIRTEDFHLLTHLEFHTSDECLEMVADLRLILE